MAANEVFNDLNLVLQLNQHLEGVSVSANGVRVPAASPSLAKQTSFKVLTNLESVSYSEAREDAQFDHQRSVFLSVSSSDLPFHLQGDKTFNEASAMAKRRALRFSETVKARIEFLWEVAGGKKQAEMAQRVRQQQLAEDETRRGQSVRRAGAINGTKQLLPPLEALDEEDYMELMLLIFKVLRDDFVLELAHKQIQCDWEVDSHHGQTLSFEQFFAAIFELVDVWTCDMEETTYERFLHLLARRITRRVAVFLDGAELKLSLSDNFDPEVVVKAIPLRTIPRFAAVARVVAATGIRTVGELAKADPKVVERERISFLERNNGGGVPEALSEMRKIGQDLETLLAMFKSIALQFENLNYTLENNVLRRVPTAAAGSRPVPGGNRRDVGGVASGTETGRKHPQVLASGEIVTEAGVNLDSRSLGNGSIGSKLSTADGNYVNSSAKTNEPQATTADSVYGSKPIADTNRSGSHAHVSASPSTEPSRINASLTDSANNSPQTKTRTQSQSSSNNNSSSFQPINTIHELQFADAGIVNALRTTFLIEKAISIERQTELPAIRSELVKFGVHMDAMKPEETVRDRYNALYDLLVLRDGESLKTLAGVMLEQIKLELSIHGITVDDEEDVEEVYDGFFSSVVTGTGDSIVQEAQRWIEGTSQGDKVNDYIQQDFHELKGINEVKLLGSKGGDEEFMSLLAKDTDAEEEESETGRKNSSPIQRKPSRALVPTLQAAVPIEDLIKPPGHIEDSLPHSLSERVTLPVRNEADHDTNNKKKKVKKKKNDHEKTRKAPDPPPPVQTPAPTEVSRSSGADLHKERMVATPRKPKLTIVTQENKQTNISESSKPVEEVVNLGPPIEAARASTPDDVKRSRTALPSHHGRPNTGLEIERVIGGNELHDTSDQHTARDALNVAIEFEEDEVATGSFDSKTDGERPISLEPKVPKIVIGGSSSAKNVPVTGRYIQLLGLGTVLITKTEHDFFQLLRSRESLDTDLVCFDIGTDLDTALDKLQTIQKRVGNRVILFGGSADEPEKTQHVALECLANGALYFALIPFDFPRLRERVMAYFENSNQPYILRQRKPPGQTAQVGSSIGSGSLFALHDEPRKVSTSVAFAKTPRRKLAVATPALPSLSHSPREIPQPIPQGISETRRADFTPIAPSTPRSSQSRNRSPRFSTAMNKLIR
ncbi:hypothetical protein P3T76_006498 [Phytophthora citrophthora]|uniref:Uncharacterized protein n=1 Tax=Phytophthora citrophthora TaxID=4793 RepID=A0AAD9GPF3_9STRA|nr:hypothetical protein P3T76_006498 [Phytophthora citrophthora]